MKAREELERAVGILMAIGLFASMLLLICSICIAMLGLPGSDTFALAGVIVLVGTPVIRVLLCLHHFTILRDWKYVALTVWVLLAMILGVVFGAA